MSMKRSDQIHMLEACLLFTDTGEWRGLFSYPNCGWDLVQAGLVNADRTITTAGRSALFLLDKGPEIELDTSVVNFSIPLPDRETK